MLLSLITVNRGCWKNFCGNRSSAENWVLGGGGGFFPLKSLYDDTYFTLTNLTPQNWKVSKAPQMSYCSVLLLRTPPGEKLTPQQTVSRRLMKHVRLTSALAHCPSAHDPQGWISISFWVFTLHLLNSQSLSVLDSVENLGQYFRQHLRAPSLLMSRRHSGA